MVRTALEADHMVHRVPVGQSVANAVARDEASPLGCIRIVDAGLKGFKNRLLRGRIGDRVAFEDEPLVERVA